MVKKALYIWAVQYHFVIPREILKGYVHKYNTERDNIAKYGQRFYDPEKMEEYQKWLKFQVYENKPEKIDLTWIGINLQNVLDMGYPTVEMNELHLEHITSQYVGVIGKGCHLYDVFASYVKYCKDADVTYFDHDEQNEQGQRMHPWLKPDYAYDTLRGVNYIGHCWVVKTDLLRQFQGQSWNPYRWLLELSDQNARFGHIAKILYGDTEPIQSEYKTVSDYISEHAVHASVQQMEDGVSTNVRYEVLNKPLISLVIPTKDGIDVLDACLKSIFDKTTYPNYEIIIADNGSVMQISKDYFAKIQAIHPNIHVFLCDGPFNFSLINNQAIFQHAAGEYVVLLNNDTSIVTPDWLERMVSYAQLDHVGSVGVRMDYPDGTIQHGGVITGKGGGFAHRYYRKPGDTKGYMFTLTVPNDVACCTAACLMIAKKKYAEVYGMNEELTVQFNDVDLGIKLLEEGYFNVFLPDVVLIHYESKSRGVDKKPEAVDRYLDEVKYAQQHYAKWIAHDPFYNDQFDKNYDYMLIVGDGSN